MVSPSSTGFAGILDDFALARYNTDGSLDTSFDTDGKVTTDFGAGNTRASAVAVQPDGKIVAAGEAHISTFDFALARYNADGSLDTTFDTDGKVTTNFSSNSDVAAAVALQPDGKIVAAGSAVPIAGGSDFALARYGTCPNAALELTAAVSRKSHGSAGMFDVPLPLSGEPGVECRSSGGKHKLVFTFSSDVVSGSASVTAGAGTVLGNPIFSGNTMTVNLKSVSDVQKITVTLSDVTSSTSQVLPDTSVSANMLIGDTTADKRVTNSDVTQTRGQVGQPVTGSNFREDVKVDGAINNADLTLVRSDVGHSLP